MITLGLIILGFIVAVVGGAIGITLLFVRDDRRGCKDVMGFVWPFVFLGVWAFGWAWLLTR